MAFSDINAETRLALMRNAALQASDAIMEIFHSGFDVEVKGDQSPVTQADRQAEAIIITVLEKEFPEIPILAEEAASRDEIPELGARFFLVDPLDGTKEFIKKTGEFTVNIALIENGRPVAGVVVAPAVGKLFEADLRLGAFRYELGPGGQPENRTPIRAVAAPADGLVAVASRSHRSPETDAYLQTLNVADFKAAGSSLKFCLIAEGGAHLYPRFGRTMEWDTAAGQAVLEAAGGHVFVYPSGEILSYGKRQQGFDNPYFIAAAPGFKP